MHTVTHLGFITSLLLIAASQATAQPKPLAPIAPADLVLEEVDGLVAVEAEHFIKQGLAEVRAWHIVHAGHIPAYPDDADDPPHDIGASGGAYLEILPDTRATHAHPLVPGENFTNEPGEMAIISYQIHFSTPGRYHVWGRTFSTGSEDNGVHVGLNGSWPESGRRWQTIRKNAWQWDSRQRTAEVHVGVPGRLFLDIPRTGAHVIQFSMREDGFEMDKFVLARDPDYVPEGMGPAPRTRVGRIPEPFPVPAGYAESAPRRAAASANNPDPSVETDLPRPFPVHWGEPPAVQTRDYGPLPGGFGRGSSTLARWIQQKLDEDALAAPTAAGPAGRASATPVSTQPRQPDGDGSVRLHGELKQWHAVKLDLAGPYADEEDREPNPFTDYRFTVVFTHETGAPVYAVPGHFTADGNAGESSAGSGVVWRAFLSPDRTGRWYYRTSFVQGPNAALDPASGAALPPFDGRSGSFTILPSDKSGRDFRGHGRLQYVGGHYLRFAASGRFFLKAGPDAPETLLACADFDNTIALKEGVPLKTWSRHLGDWRPGDPVWRGDKGKGLIGALNYLAGKGVNTFSFLPYNAGGDGDNVWPLVSRDDKLRYDVSKLAQWDLVFSHAQKLGLHLHFKLQETEIDDHRVSPARDPKLIPEALDAGLLGMERRLYLREIVSRFAHHLALNWNLGEENTQTSDEQRDMAAHLALIDPYGHPIVVHTYPGEQDRVYTPLLGAGSVLTGASLQNPWDAAHARTLRWVRASAAAGRPWVVANDEQNPAGLGVPPDPGYRGFDGSNQRGNPVGYDLHDIRKRTLWGNLMAGGAGVEYYFGYQLPENDLLAEDFRSRDRSWDYCRIAIEFFHEQKIPFWRMANANALVGNTEPDNSRYCFAAEDEVYLVYLPEGGNCDLDLRGATGAFTVSWFNPRAGGRPGSGAVRRVKGGGTVALGSPPAEPGEDWLVVVRR